MKIGEHTIIYEPPTTTIDVTRPSLIEIGNFVKITKGVTILTHGYDWSVIRKKYGEVIGSAGKVTIGNNVFIGMHSTILKSTTIGNNVIIGANSLVAKDIPDNVVAAGNPAKIIMTLDDYYLKRKSIYVHEAKEFVHSFYEVNGHLPNVQQIFEFSPLFTNRDENMVAINQNLNMLLTDGGGISENIDLFLKSKPTFNTFQLFLDWCMEDYDKS